MVSPSGTRNAGWQRSVSHGKEDAELRICPPSKDKSCENSVRVLSLHKPFTVSLYGCRLNKVPHVLIQSMRTSFCIYRQTKRQNSARCQMPGQGLTVSRLLLLYICPMYVAASHRRGTSHCLSCTMEEQWSGDRLQEQRARAKVSQPAFHCAAFDLCRLSARRGRSSQRTDRIGDG